MATEENVFETIELLSGVNAVVESSTVDNSCVAVKSDIVVADEIAPVVSLKPVLDVSFTRVALEDSPEVITPVAGVGVAAVFRDDDRDGNDENLEYTRGDEDECKYVTADNKLAEGESLKLEYTVPILVDVNTKRLLSVKTIDSDPNLTLFAELEVETEDLLAKRVLSVDMSLVVLADDIRVLMLSWEELKPFADDVVMASEVAGEDEVK